MSIKSENDCPLWLTGMHTTKNGASTSIVKGIAVKNQC